MLTIWGRINSINVMKVLWTCAELGIAYERIDAGMQRGGCWMLIGAVVAGGAVVVVVEGRKVVTGSVTGGRVVEGRIDERAAARDAYDAAIAAQVGARHRIGGAYCRPPCVQSLFKPRSILSGLPMPRWRSKLSP